jgi:hypothetical protein
VVSWRCKNQRLLGFLLSNEERKGLPPEAVGEVVYRALTAAKPNVRYAVVGKKLQDWFLPSLLPKRMVDRLIGRQTGLLAAKG